MTQNNHFETQGAMLVTSGYLAANENASANIHLYLSNLTKQDK